MPVRRRVEVLPVGPEEAEEVRRQAASEPSAPALAAPPATADACWRCSARSGNRAVGQMIARNGGEGSGATATAKTPKDRSRTR